VSAGHPWLLPSFRRVVSRSPAAYSSDGIPRIIKALPLPTPAAAAYINGGSANVHFSELFGLEDSPMRPVVKPFPHHNSPGFTRGLHITTSLLLLLLAGAALLTPPGEGRASLPQPALKLGAGDKADDVVRRGLLGGANVPTSIFAVRQHLEQQLGGKLKSHLVANGGHEHPTRRPVMFMCFETYAGPGGGKPVEDDELFLGFFLGAEKGGDTLTVLPGFVELIAWDRSKRVYNFWELIGTTWHYRGDSRDILDDAARIHVGAAKPQFGQRLRCSGCHTLGGPILKELQAPHNDWWTARHPLPTGPWKLEKGKDLTNPRQLAAHLFHNAAGASHLGTQVKKGIDRLIAGGIHHADTRSLKEQLRSLLGTMEMNLVSDAVPFGEREAKGEAVVIPVEFFVDARLVQKKPTVAVPLATYRAALKATGTHFPPGAKVPSETRHAFLVPSRSYIDNRLIDALIARGLLDEELVADVLAVDFTTPVYSGQRAGLIRYVPDTAKDVKDLREQLIAVLKQAPAKDSAAMELLANLTDPAREAKHHRKAAEAYLEACAKAAAKQEVVTDWLKVASQRRVEIAEAETATNPQGNILERGFRLIFPADQLQSRPGKLRLDPQTGGCMR
jgi:hypothetical protein